MDQQTSMLVVTIVLVALYALVMISRTIFVGIAVSGILMGVATFIVFAALFAGFFLFLVGGLFIALFGIEVTPDGIARGILVQVVAGLLTPAIYIALITPGLIAIRRRVPWPKAVTICLIPVVVVACGLPLWDYFAVRSRYKALAGEELSLPVPQRPRRLSIDLTAYGNYSIGANDPLEEFPCEEFCLKLLTSGQADAIRLQKTIKLVMRVGGINISSASAVFRVAQGEICNSSGYRRPRAIAPVIGAGLACILGEPDQPLPGAVEVSIMPVPDEEGASGQKIEISESTKNLWRRAAVGAKTVSVPYMLDLDWQPYRREILFGPFSPDRRYREMPGGLLRAVLTRQLGYDLN